nr:glycine/sarcosine/betaine reductase component B subunit [Brachyspira innocens]
MELHIGNFYVKDIKFGDKTKFENSTLTINKEEALSIVKEDSHITEADIIIVKPGDMVRIVPVKEAIEPRCRLDGKTIFPGF